MKRTYVLGGILAAAVLAGGGFAVDAALSSPVAAATPSSTSAANVGTASLAPGTALVDGSGRALYLFEADQGSMSACTGLCTQIWPPALTSGPASTVSGDVQAQLLGSAVRPDGAQQMTYGGHPLYYFTGDRKPGDVHGQGLNKFGGLWYVVDPDGTALTSSAAAPAAAPAPAPSRSTGAYGY